MGKKSDRHSEKSKYDNLHQVYIFNLLSNKNDQIVIMTDLLTRDADATPGKVAIYTDN